MKVLCPAVGSGEVGAFRDDPGARYEGGHSNESNEMARHQLNSMEIFCTEPQAINPEITQAVRLEVF